MQTTQTRTTRRAKSSSAKALNPSGSIRHGFLGCQASAQDIANLTTSVADRFLQRHMASLTTAVQVGLRDAAQLAISHPTPATLKGAFDAADAVQAACRSVRRRLREIDSPRLQVGVQVFIAGVMAGIAVLEDGLERIPLLPVSAPDFPEVEE